MSRYTGNYVAGDGRTDQDEQMQYGPPNLFEEKECDEEIPEEECCEHGKDIQDYCPECAKEEFEEIFVDWDNDIEDRIDEINDEVDAAK
jgi:hypothetical protein